MVVVVVVVVVIVPLVWLMSSIFSGTKKHLSSFQKLEFSDRLTNITENPHFTIMVHIAGHQMELLGVFRHPWWID